MHGGCPVAGSPACRPIRPIGHRMLTSSCSLTTCMHGRNLNQPGLPCLSPIKLLQVLLVGGFARSPYLESRVRSALTTSGLASRVVVPRMPHAAVLAGAVPFVNQSSSQSTDTHS